LDRQIFDVLKADHPQSVRHVFYRMTDPRLDEPVEKSDRGYRHVQARILAMRRDLTLPYGWITDSTRQGYHTNTYGSGAEFVRAVKGLYRAPLWNQTNVHVEVWTESRSIAGVLRADCKELAVSLYPCGGFASVTLAYEAVANIVDQYEAVDWMIYYIGDYDPAGVIIDEALERELRRHLGAYPEDIRLFFERLAITEEQNRRVRPAH
jgi:hypothetical protein